MKNKCWQLVMKLSKKAAKKNEVPVGAIIVKNDQIIARAYNKREKNHDVTGHAEVLVIKKASKRLRSWKLTDCDLYVSLKPCSICENIIKQSRIANVYYLVDKPNFKKEYSNTNFENWKDESLTTEYQEILSNFFKNLRK